MIETSQEYPVAALLISIAIVFLSLNFIWNGSF